MTVNYFYDHLDRVVKKCYNNNEDTAFLYLYNGLGALSSVTDTATQEKISYVYDTVGRPSETRTEKGDNIFRVLYGYDEISRPNSLIYKYNGAYTQKYSTSYIADNRITLFKLNNGQSDVFSIAPMFDTLGRQTSRTLKNGSGAQVDKEVYSFLAGAGGNNASTSVISSVGYYGADSTVDETYTYTYDDIGNIKTVSKNGVQIAAYTYNSLNILTGYTDAGNIYHSYGYTPGHNLQEIDNYGILYQDDVWLDRATKIFNFLSMREYAVTYDEIGNTLSYRDGMSFTWKNGRQLATFTQGQTSASYDYNESGIRNKKTVNGVTTTFQLAGSMIVSENRNGNIIQYYYNEAGSVIGLRYNGNDYFFRRNLQGDIISILNTAGQTVVSYEYDPWGNILSTEGSLASTLGVANPFRYRGYYYDTESGLYYLQTRYYDPAVGRFINADGYTSTGQGFLGNNMYAYCLNNPISYTDPSGRASQRVFVESQTEGAIIFQESIGNPERIPISKKKEVYGPSLRDVTDEIDKPLQEKAHEFEIISIFRNVSKIVEGLVYLDFYNTVADNNPWDIKVDTSWEETIGTAYPGNIDTKVLYRGRIMTPENLGNYTYGYLGAAYRINLDILYLGSYYAAGFPNIGTTAYDNEMFEDRPYIKLGYMTYFNDIGK